MPKGLLFAAAMLAAVLAPPATSAAQTAAASTAPTPDETRDRNLRAYAELLRADIRADRVQALRAAIASGTYETENRLSAAIDRLLDEVA